MEPYVLSVYSTYLSNVDFVHIRIFTSLAHFNLKHKSNPILGFDLCGDDCADHSVSQLLAHGINLTNTANLDSYSELAFDHFFNITLFDNEFWMSFFVHGEKTI